MNNFLNRREMMWKWAKGTLTAATKRYITDTYGAAVYSNLLIYLNQLADKTLQASLINEDPDIVCALVDAGVKRYVRNETGGYIRLNYMHNTNTGAEIEFRMVSFGSWASLFGARQDSFQTAAYILRFYSSSAYLCYNRTGAEAYNSTSTTIGTHYVVDTKGTTATVYQDGEVVNTITGGTNDAGTNEWLMFASNTAGAGGLTAEYNGVMDISNFAIKESGEVIKHLVPFVLGSDRTAASCWPQVAQSAGAVGMVDILTGIFYPNAGSGSFSIVTE